MSKTKRKSAVGGPRGGIRAGSRSLRGWQWEGRGKLVSRPIRCRRDDWYIARARLADGVRIAGARLVMRFLKRDVLIQQRCLRLHASPTVNDTTELVGWIQTPEEATHLQLLVTDSRLLTRIDEIEFQDVSERDPKCHPLAAIPRWSVHKPPLEVRRVLLPSSLSGLADHLDWCDVELLERPESVRQLRKRIRGGGAILEPEWVEELKLSLADVEMLAEASCLIVGLETIAALASSANVAKAETCVHASPDGIMSARVEYGDVATRGIAMQDVVPYTALDEDGDFQMRVLRANKSWKTYAEDVDFATLLSSETPWADEHADVLSAARPTRGGELVATDLPWLVAGEFGPSLSPRIMAHLLRMQLGGPVADHVQYWNRWDDGDIIVRDIGDLMKRYPVIRAVRWASGEAGLAHLGVCVLPVDGVIKRHTVFQTGRIDNADIHDGVPPEPMMIFMKWLGREVAEGTDWALRHLKGHLVTWQFEAVDGLRYAANFDAAPEPAGVRRDVVHMRTGGSEGAADFLIPVNEGIHGDGSLEYQDWLTRELCAVLERPNRCG